MRSAPLDKCWGSMYLPWGFDKGISCGVEMITKTLLSAHITVTVGDPPVPGMLFSTAPFPILPGGASQVINVPATHPSGTLSASLVVSHTVLSGTLTA